MTNNKNQIEELFGAGAHYGFKKARRNPSVVPFLFGAKNGNDIFDLEKTSIKLDEAKKAIETVAQSGKQILFVGSKNEAKSFVKMAAEGLNMPYVTGRWIGGTLTNFKEIRRRVDRLEGLRGEKESGSNLEKYTKKERLLLDREMNKLDTMFGGIVEMRALPAILVVVDSEYEHTAMREATHLGIPTIALVNTDCDLKKVTYPIPCNDSAAKSIEYIINTLAGAYKNNSSNKDSATADDNK